MWTKACRAFIPGATVHAFELVPATFERLRRDVSTDSGVICNAVGLADRCGEAVANVHPSASELATLFAGGPDIHRAEFSTVTVRLLTGDEYCKANSISTIDLLKIDTEGAEGSVLAGLQEMLAQNAIGVIQFEYGMANIYSRVLLRDLYELLSAKGFAIGKLFPNGVAFSDYRPEQEDFRGPNFVAVHKSRAPLMALLAHA